MKTHLKLNKITRKEELMYRRAMSVCEFLVYSDDSAYPVCPKCNSAMERDYQSFCDRCGQKLDWNDFDNAHANYLFPVKI